MQHSIPEDCHNTKGSDQTYPVAPGTSWAIGALAGHAVKQPHERRLVGSIIDHHATHPATSSASISPLDTSGLRMRHG
jgi:hypothetical protein